MFLCDKVNLRAQSPGTKIPKCLGTNTKKQRKMVLKVTHKYLLE